MASFDFQPREAQLAWRVYKIYYHDHGRLASLAGRVRREPRAKRQRIASIRASVYSCYLVCSLGLLLVHWRRRARRRRSKTKSSPVERTARTQRSRKRSVFFALRRAQKHVGGVGAREAATRKPDENPHEKHKRGAVRVRVARACDEEDFRDCVTGEGMGCERESDCVPGSPGRGGFGKWGRLVGGACMRRQMVSGWVSRGDP